MSSQYSIPYPKSLRDKLDENAELGGPIIALQSSLGRWLGHSRLPFFWDYTDHGIDHIAAVLDMCECLRTPESDDVFTVADAATLILAVLLHDIGMHLTPEGFAALIAPSNSKSLIPDMDFKSWPELWEEFLQEASRFDDRTWIKITGQPNPIRIDTAKTEWNDDDEKRLIGEFIRRHHPRIAHEVAVLGHLGEGKNRIDFSAIPNHLRDLGGLIARSHGMPMRKCLGYRKHIYREKREYQGIHAPYLMALLRVADVLQIQPERAPGEVLAMKQLKTEVSQLEWNVHDSVINISYNADDNEAIVIDAMPLEVKTFLRLKEWLGWIQTELDQSWAVLGEIYSRHGHDRRPELSLDKLEMSLRRVLSNLDDVNEFAKNPEVKYVPERLVFDTAGPRILKLLVGPLYGDRPEVGVRELLANALDAVRERIHWEETHAISLTLREQEAPIVMSLDEDDNGRKWFTIIDQGIGMSVDVLQNYFLKAGASFRDSAAWRRANVDPNGKSDVIRIGKFGIGAFAAFLIGDIIEVTTRHAEATRGYRFCASIDTDPIEISTVECSVGTCIRVATDDATYRLLAKNGHEWDWYCLDYPRIVRRRSNDGHSFPQSTVLPNNSDELPPVWTDVNVDGFEHVSWSYSGHDVSSICNGIEIPNELADAGMPLGGYTIPFPKLYLVDPDGKLELTLDRMNLIDEPPSWVVGWELYWDLVASFFAYMFRRMPLDRPGAVIASESDLLFPNATRYYLSDSTFPRGWILSEHDAVPVDKWASHRAGLKRIYVVGSRMVRAKNGARPKELTIPFDCLHTDAGMLLHFDRHEDIAVVLANVIYLATLCSSCEAQFADLGYKTKLRSPPTNIRIVSVTPLEKLVPNELMAELADVQKEWSRSNYTCWQFGHCPNFDDRLPGILDLCLSWGTSDVIIVECYVEEPVKEEGYTGFDDFWLEIMGDNTRVPYSLDLRKTRFRQAYEQFEDFYFPHWDAMDEENDKLKKDRKQS